MPFYNRKMKKMKKDKKKLKKNVLIPLFKWK